MYYTKNHLYYNKDVNLNKTNLEKSIFGMRQKIKILSSY